MNQPNQVNYEALAAQVLGKHRTPVQQANRTPVQQANRTPVQQANRTPVQQASRNSYRNSRETHSQTQDERVRNFENLLSEHQKDYLMKKTGCLEEELEKALHIISISTPKPKNIMGYLQTSAFYKGVCILEPTQADGQELSDDEKWAKNEAQRKQRDVSRPLTTALQWFQNLPQETYETVKNNILQRHPDLRVHFGEHPKPFGVLMVIFLREEYARMQGDRLLTKFEDAPF